MKETVYRSGGIMRAILAGTLAAFTTLISSNAQAEVQYSLNSYTDFGGGFIRIESFTLLSSTFLNSDRVFSAPELGPNCKMGFGYACDHVDFVIDTNAAGWGGLPGTSGMAAWNDHSSADFYYFPVAAMSQYGVHYSSANNGILTVSSVPEPGTLGLLAAGLLPIFMAHTARHKTKSESSADIGS